MRAVLCHILLVLILKASMISASAAEQFKYYVWIDEEGIVHAEDEAPKGRDYQVRIIEDINANVVPAEDFRPYGDLPAPLGEESGDAPEATASAEDPGDASGAGAGQASESADPVSPAAQE
jgi:hypothetical protein